MQDAIKGPSAVELLSFRQRTNYQTAEFQDFVVRSVVNLRMAVRPRGAHKTATGEKALRTEVHSNVWMRREQ